jgi:hypothetical protein
MTHLFRRSCRQELRLIHARDMNGPGSSQAAEMCMTEQNKLSFDHSEQGAGDSLVLHAVFIIPSFRCNGVEFVEQRAIVNFTQGLCTFSVGRPGDLRG